MRGEGEWLVQFISIIGWRTHCASEVGVINGPSERDGGSRDPFVVKVIIAGLPMSELRSCQLVVE